MRWTQDDSPGVLPNSKLSVVGTFQSLGLSLPLQENVDMGVLSLQF